MCRLKKFTPYGTYLLAIVCLLVYCCGWHPSAYLDEVWKHPWQLVTSQFGHVNLAHLMGNCLFLMLLGPFCEKQLGFKRFIGLYLMSGVGGALIFKIVYPAGQILGASAAISGLMAVYPLLQYSKVSKLLNGLFVGWLFYTNFLSFALSLVTGFPEEIAFLAHLGGGLVGLLSYIMMLPSL